MSSASQPKRSPELRHMKLETYLGDPQHDVPTDLPKRTKLNKTGKEVNVKLNTFNVIDFPREPVYQYDVRKRSGP